MGNTQLDISPSCHYISRRVPRILPTGAALLDKL
jgi:hypothetical protein